MGREHELAALLAVVSQPPGVVLVEGEAGVGKSRLVREMGRHLSDGPSEVLVGHCHPAPRPFPLGPVLEALGGVGAAVRRRPLTPVVGALRPLLPEIASDLPPQPRQLPDPDAEMHRRFRGLRELLNALGIVLVLEDLQWADRQTVQFLHLLLAQPPERLGLVLTYRREEVAGAPGVQALLGGRAEEVGKTYVCLSAFALEDTERLAAARIEPGEVSEEFANGLHERSGGVPLAIEELIVGLRALHPVPLRGRWSPAALAALDLPPALVDATLARMQRLPVDAQSVARAAAVVESAATEELLARVAGLPLSRALAGLDQVLDAGLLAEQHRTHAFRHRFAQQAVYQRLAGPERRRLHLRAARALEDRPPSAALARIAHHFKEAGRTRKWLRYAEEAADEAATEGREREAVTILLDVLGCADLPSTTRVRLATKLGSYAVSAATCHPAISVLRDTLEESGPISTGPRGELRLHLATLLYSANDLSWRDEMTEALKDLDRRPGLAARAMVDLAWPSMDHGDAREGLSWLEHAAEAAGRQADPAVWRSVSLSRAMFLLCLGDSSGWDVLASVPLDSSLDDPLQTVRDCHELAVTAYMLGHDRRGNEFVDEADAIRGDLGGQGYDPFRERARGLLDWAGGRWDDLEERARRLWESASNNPGLSLCGQKLLASVVLSRGRLDEAESLLTTVVRDAHAAGKLYVFAPASGGLARIHLSRGRVEAACEIGTLGADAVRTKGVWSLATEVLPVAAEALIASGRADEARALVQEFGRELNGKDAPAPAAALAVCQGMIEEAEGRFEEAARRFAGAEQMWGALPRPYEAMHTRERQGRCLVADGDGRGEEVLLSALQGFESLGASWDAGRVRRTMRDHGVKVPYPWRGGRRHYGSDLSPREAEVIRLAAAGGTNRDIAAALFLSHKTVEKHVASAVRKLGLTRATVGQAVERMTGTTVGSSPPSLQRDNPCVAEGGGKGWAWGRAGAQSPT